MRFVHNSVPVYPSRFRQVCLEFRIYSGIREERTRACTWAVNLFFFFHFCFFLFPVSTVKNLKLISFSEMDTSGNLVCDHFSCQENKSVPHFQPVVM